MNSKAIAVMALLLAGAAGTAVAEPDVMFAAQSEAIAFAARERLGNSLHALAAPLPQAALGAGPRVTEPRAGLNHSQSALWAARRLLDVDVAVQRPRSRGKVMAGP